MSIGAMLALLLALGLSLIGLVERRREKDLGNIYCWFGAFFLVLACFLHDADRRELQEEQSVTTESQINFDGQEVDADKVVLKDYEITIKNDNIILSRRDEK